MNSGALWFKNSIPFPPTVLSSSESQAVHREFAYPLVGSPWNFPRVNWNAGFQIGRQRDGVAGSGLNLLHANKIPIRYPPPCVRVVRYNPGEQPIPSNHYFPKKHAAPYLPRVTYSSARLFRLVATSWCSEPSAFSIIARARENKDPASLYLP